MSDKHYDYNGVQLEIIFYQNGFNYRYNTDLKSDSSPDNNAIFYNQTIERKRYFKSKLKAIYDDVDFERVQIRGELPEDTSDLFFILKKQEVRAVYFDCNGNGSDTYRLVFQAIKKYRVPMDVVTSVISIFDENIQEIKKSDDHNYAVTYLNDVRFVSDKEMLYLLSSGTTKGLYLYIMVVVSLREGFDLLIDEVETHFHKTLVENLITLYKTSLVNKHGASLFFTTHYCEVLDFFNRQDNVWVCRSEQNIEVKSIFDGYKVRPGLLKSNQYYSNAFQTAVNYTALMDFKRTLMA